MKHASSVSFIETCLLMKLK